MDPINNSHISPNYSNKESYKQDLNNKNSDHKKKQENLIKSVSDSVNLSSESLLAYIDSLEPKPDTLEITTSVDRKNTDLLIGDHLGSLKLILDGNNNTIKGSTEDDVIYIEGKKNKIYSDENNDTVFIVGNSNTYENSAGEDQFVALGNTNKITSLSNQSISGVVNGDNNQVTGSIADDFIISNGSKNRITTNEGDDVVISNGDNQILMTGDGSDLIISEGNAQSIRAGDGDDLITTNGSGNIYGENGNDVLEISGKLNNAYAGSGDDIIRVLDSNNTLNGNDGNDTFQVQFDKGYLTINGDEGFDIIEVDLNLEKFASIVNNNKISFYLREDSSNVLELSVSDIELIKFNDGTIKTISELSELVGLSDDIILEESSSAVNSSNAINNVNIDIDSNSLIEIQSTSTSTILTYLDSNNENKSITLKGYDFLTFEDNVQINLQEYPNLEFIDINPYDSLVVTELISEDQYISKFIDPISEEVLLTKEFNSENLSFLFKDGTLIKAQDFVRDFTGKSQEIDETNGTVDSESEASNVAKLSIDTQNIYSVKQIGFSQYSIEHSENDDSISFLLLNDFQYIETKEGITLSLNELSTSIREIDQVERSRGVYEAAHDRSAFRRQAYNLTKDGSFLEGLISGGYSDLTTDEKNILIGNAQILEDSISFTSDDSDGLVDAATKKFITTSVANLLKNRTDVFQSLVDSKLTLNFTKNADFGGDASGFVTGFAELSGDDNAPEFSVSLTYSTFYGGIYDEKDGDNVGIHEITHILDFLDIKNEGLPIHMNSETGKTFKEVRTSLFEQSGGDEIGTIRNYAFTTDFEFLSVSVENFYEDPTGLASSSTELYDVMADFFNQET